MKVLYGLWVGIVAVSASHWLQKRDVYPGIEVVEPDCTDLYGCGGMFTPINSVMRDPDFSKLVHSDGHLSLNCSMSALSGARNCGTGMSRFCPGPFTRNELLLAWEHFCNSEGDVVSLKDCWNSVQVHIAITICSAQTDHDPSSTMPDCVDNEVSSLPMCGENASQLLRELLVKEYEEHMSFDQNV